MIYIIRHSLKRTGAGDEYSDQVRDPTIRRARIIETAEALFRRLGFAKTAVAERQRRSWACSTANIYQFFPVQDRHRPGHLSALAS